MNNPVNEIDETGYFIWWVAAIIVAVTIGVTVGISVGVQLATTGTINGIQVLFDAIMGALSGLLMVTGLGPLGMALWNGAFGFVGSVISQWIGTGSFSKIQWGEALLSAGLNMLVNIKGQGAARNAKYLNTNLLSNSDYIKADKAYNRVLRKISNNGYKYASNAAKYKKEKFNALQQTKNKILSSLKVASLKNSVLWSSGVYGIQGIYAIATYYLRNF